IVMPDAIEPVARHHLPRTRVILATPGALIPLERDTEATAGLVEHPDALGHHLLTDSVAGNQRNPVLAHCTPPPRTRVRTVHDVARVVIVYRAWARRLVPFH